jgi:hypothetical protein
VEFKTWGKGRMLNLARLSWIAVVPSMLSAPLGSPSSAVAPFQGPAYYTYPRLRPPRSSLRLRVDMGVEVSNSSDSVVDTLPFGWMDATLGR